MKPVSRVLKSDIRILSWVEQRRGLCFPIEMSCPLLRDYVEQHDIRMEKKVVLEMNWIFLTLFSND